MLSKLSPPAVTIVIPCWNYARFISQTIASVQAQTLNNFEAIIVNDGSTDNSAEVIAESIAHDARFRLITIPNGGVANARNTGILAATAPFICCLDADDMIEPEFLETCVSALEADRGLGIAYTGLRVMNEAGERSPHISTFPPEWNHDEMLQRRNCVPTANVFRRESWRRAGGYRPQHTPAEDAGLWGRMGNLGYRAKKVTDEALFIYRLHANSLSQSVRTHEKEEPNWMQYPFVADNRHPFASQAKPAQWSHPVRNFDKPVISVIIPVGKGHENILYRALDSVEYQTLREWETIVVNDTGAPLPLIGYEWVKVLDCDGRNAAMARNMGIRQARAPLVSFLDADDYFLPTFLEKMVREYKRSQGRYIYCDWISVNKEGVEEPHITPEFDAQQMFKSKSMHSINVVMRRKDALAYPFDEQMDTWEDSDLFMNLVAHGICGKRLNEALIVYDYNTGFLREKGETKKQKLIDLLYNKYSDYIEGRTMCSCNQTSGKSGTLSAQEMAESLSMQNGDSVLVEYNGAQAGHSVKGAATGQMYGYRQKGDVFLIWKADAMATPDLYIPVMSVETEMEQTPEPPVPELV